MAPSSRFPLMVAPLSTMRPSRRSRRSASMPVSSLSESSIIRSSQSFTFPGRKERTLPPTKRPRFRRLPLTTSLGLILFSTVPGGVRAVRLYASLSADSQVVDIDEDEADTPLTLHGSIGNGGALGYLILIPPQHGTLDDTAPNVTYTPISTSTAQIASRLVSITGRQGLRAQFRSL